MGTDLPLLSNPTLGSVLSFVVAFVLPLAAGLLTKPKWAGHTKGAVLLGLAFVKTVIEAAITAMAAGAHFNLWAVLISTGVTFGVAVLGYFGILKNSPLAIAAQNSLVKDDPTYDPDKFESAPL